MAKYYAHTFELTVITDKPGPLDTEINGYFDLMVNGMEDDFVHHAHFADLEIKELTEDEKTEYSIDEEDEDEEEEPELATSPDVA